MEKTYQMTTKELIRLLQEKLSENGDLPIRFGEEENQFDDMGSSVPVGGVVTIMEDENTPKYEIVMSGWAMQEMGS